MSRSLHRRLLISALGPLALLAVLGALALQWAFADAVVRGFDRAMADKLDTLIAGIDVEADGLPSLQRGPDEAVFNRVRSGWYWQVTQEDRALLRSRSLWDVRLAQPTASETLHSFDLTGPGEQSLRAIQRQVLLPGMSAPITLLMTGPRDGLNAEIIGFQRLLWSGIAGLILLAAASFALQVRLGLAPLRRFGSDVAAVRRGQRGTVDAGGIRELENVADELNEALAQNGRLAESGRKLAGDLAHAIKTPLALLKTRVAADDLESQRAVTRISEVVDRHLARASADARKAHAHSNLEVVLPELAALFSQLYADRAVTLELAIPKTIRVGCEASDLQEMLGNVLDNACRAARSRVLIRAAIHAQRCLIQIEDDGLGLDVENLALLGERGLRFDESTPGTGLGVSISRDIADSYGGRLSFRQGAAGGLVAEFDLPA